MPRTTRRHFLTSVPAAVAAGVALPSVLDAQRGGGAPPKFGRDALKCAEQIDGLHFTDAEEDMALGPASRNLDSYEELRTLNVPLDTEPAITFRPSLPGKLEEIRERKRRAAEQSHKSADRETGA